MSLDLLDNGLTLIRLLVENQRLEIDALQKPRDALSGALIVTVHDKNLSA